MNREKAISILAKIEVLEVAAVLIGTFGETGEKHGGFFDDDSFLSSFDKHQGVLANQLNERANKLRLKYNIDRNVFKY